MTTPPGPTTARPPCPQCSSGHGDARIVLLKGQGRIVTYVCDRCLYEWDVTEQRKSYKPSGFCGGNFRRMALLASWRFKNPGCTSSGERTDRVYRTRRPLEAASLSSSCGIVSRFAAVLLRMQPVLSPVPPQSARAACPALPPDVDADVCRWGDGLHSWSRSFEQAYLADVPSAVHKCTLKLAVLRSRPVFANPTTALAARLDYSPALRGSR